MLRQSAARTIRHFAIAITAVALQDHATAAQPAAMKAWDAYTNEFVEETFKAQPNYAVWAGRHEFDGRFPDWSASGIKKEITRLHVARKRATSFRDSELDDNQRFERDYLLAVIDDDLFWLEAVKWPFRSPTFYSWGLSPQVYVARE